MNRSKFVVVGLGAIGRYLVENLAEEYEIVCIDSDPAAPESAQGLREELQVVVGDATSRLVLEDAGVGEADAVILTATTDRVNLEVAQLLAAHFQVHRVVSVAVTPDATRKLADLGVEVENLFTQSAQAIRNRIERRARTAQGVGLGRGEILEVEVHPNSRLVGKPLATLAPQRWRVGLVYREGRILLPSGRTVLKGRDRIVAVGEPSVLKTVSEMLTFRFQRFPLEYGATLLVHLSGREEAPFFDELDYLLSVFPLEHVTLLVSKRAAALRRKVAWSPGPSIRLEERETTDLPLEALTRCAEDPEDRPGLIVLSAPAVFGARLPLTLDLRAKTFLQRLSQAAESPILLAAGTHPYTDVVVPCVEGVDVQHVLESVFEMAPSLHHKSTALLVKPSRYLSADSESAHYEEVRKTVSDMSLIYRVSAQSRLLEGNPVRAVGAALPEFRLAVMDTGGWSRGRWVASVLDPDPAWHVARNSPISTLLVPSSEEAL